MGGCDGVTGGRVAKRGRSQTLHRILLAAFTIVQLLHCHSKKTATNVITQTELYNKILTEAFVRITLLQRKKMITTNNGGF